MENRETQDRVKQSKIVITNRLYTSLSGVTKVISATENCISILLCDEGMSIEGNNLHVQKLDIESKVLEIEGQICGIKFGKAKTKNFIKRIFS